MTVPLSKLIQSEDPTLFKIHLASFNGDRHPLDVFVEDREIWHRWNSFQETRNQFNRRFVFSLIDFYPEKHIWLFGGIYEILDRKPIPRSHSYIIRLDEAYSELIGRLKVRFPRPSRGRSIKFEKHFEQMEISELLKEPYTGEEFPGYENISHEFTQLESVIKLQRVDWRAALESVKGVYVIFDKLSGKKYVGAAYGETGIWSRWSTYIGTGHGKHSDQLTKVINEKGIEYAREHFRLTLLEYRPAKTDDKVIQEREGFWKNALLSRGKLGYNSN